MSITLKTLQNQKNKQQNQTHAHAFISNEHVFICLSTTLFKNVSGRLGVTYVSTPFPSGMAEALKASSEPLRKDAAECSARLRVGFRPRSHATAPVPQLRDGDLIPFSMTLGDPQLVAPPFSAR